jgi:phosphoglycolate phosphatase
MLILFDIDLTLLTTDGAGMKALGDAGRDRFGPGFDETCTDYGGRLDPLIIHDLLVANGVDPSVEHAHEMRAGYAHHLERRLRECPAKALPGTGALIDSLAQIERVTLGVLTGNFEPTGRMKLSSAGLDREEFVVNVWGDQSPHEPPERAHLPAVAIERYREQIDPAIEPEQVVVIGDTVHDVSCALANGCRVLAVATGHASAEELEGAGAHRVVASLGDTESIMDWIAR